MHGQYKDKWPQSKHRGSKSLIKLFTKKRYEKMAWEVHQLE